MIEGRSHIIHDNIKVGTLSFCIKGRMCVEGVGEWGAEKFVSVRVGGVTVHTDELRDLTSSLKKKKKLGST